MAGVVQLPDSVRSTRIRLHSVDVLRGLVMVIMAIDHVRDFFNAYSQQFSPEDLEHATAAIFFTRWITHFCAPVFVFLAGTGAWLSGRSKPPSAVSKFLLTRGLWLIVVEMTLVLTGTSFNLSYTYIVWQVIWAIGWSMIALSALMFLPWRTLLAFSLVVIAGHNLLDGIQPEAFGSFSGVWQILHVGFSFIQLSEDHTIIAAYPLIPWIAVMSAGYCFGCVLDMDAAARRRVLWQLGGAITMAFIVVRAINAYGDPTPWSVQPTATKTVLSFLNASKYPPSLDYLLMTLGPAMLFLAAIDGVAVSDWNPLLVFGKVPFFYYIAHWYTLHGVAVLLALVRYGHAEFLFGFPPSMLGPGAEGYPPDYGYSLPTTYLIWAAIVAALYPLCLWFARLKARSRAPWLSYL